MGSWGFFDNSDFITQAHPSTAALLVEDRPPAVTVRNLVIDAVARLPSGWGSKADVVASLLLSRFIKANVDEKLLQRGEFWMWCYGQ